MNRIWLIVFGDFISFFISFIFLILIRFKISDYSTMANLHLIPFIILYLFWVLIFYIFGLYDLMTIKPTIPYLKRWFLALASSLLLGLLLFYFIPAFGITPKINLFIQVILFSIFSFIFRRIIYTLFAHIITRPAILVGTSSYLNELKNIISTHPQIGLQTIRHLKDIGEVDLNINNIKNTLIILDKDKKTIDENIIKVYKQGVDIIDTAKAYEKYLHKIPVEYIDISFIIENVNINKDILYRFITNTSNKIFSIFIILVTLPFILLSALFIYLYDKGPVFYTQKRIGINGKIFKLYKLRSMKINSEENGAVWCTGQNDPRITPVGKILRRLHIDEIPQMINILKGELTLIGPRPERPEFVSQLIQDIPYYALRHIVRPGFTGWAQIKYRYAKTIEDSKEKFEYDLYYIKNRNIFIDFGILIRTIQIVFTHK